jgi:hypothetical protein
MTSFCGVCAQPATARCTKCKAVWYCSKEHQKLDWKIHKQTCILVVEGEYSEEESVKRFTDIQKQILRSYGKNFSPSEQYQKLKYVKICAYCAKVQSQNSHDFISCSKCSGISYCCQEHEQKVSNKHTKVCNDLQFANKCAELLKTFQNEFNPPYVSLTREATYNHANLIEGGWERYLPQRASRDLREEYVRAGRCDPAWAKALTDNYNDVSEAVLTENLSFPLTVLFSLHKLYNLGQNYHMFIQALPEIPQLGKTLTIHVLGAQEITELMMSVKYREITSCLPGVDSLEIFMIGPQVRDMTRNDMLGKFLGITCVNGLYHDVFHKIPENHRIPQLAIAFNCGVADTPNTWIPTIQFLTKQRIRASFTSYCDSEGQKDAKIIGQYAQVVYGPIVNPFSSKKALRDIGVPFGGVFYTNHIITLVKHVATTPQVNIIETSL